MNHNVYLCYLVLKMLDGVSSIKYGFIGEVV